MTDYALATARPSTTTPTRTDSHKRSIEGARGDLLRTLTSALGKKAVAAIFRVSVRTVDRWLAKNADEMAMDTERLLRDTHQVYAIIEDADDAHVARAWFLGMNPNLSDRSPIEVLTEGDTRQVVAAARAYANGA